jgi:hypothetical protein
MSSSIKDSSHIDTKYLAYLLQSIYYLETKFHRYIMDLFLLRCLRIGIHSKSTVSALA